MLLTHRPLRSNDNIHRVLIDLSTLLEAPYTRENSLVLPRRAHGRLWRGSVVAYLIVVRHAYPFEIEGGGGPVWSCLQPESARFGPHAEHQQLGARAPLPNHFHGSDDKPTKVFETWGRIQPWGRSYRARLAQY